MQHSGEIGGVAGVDIGDKRSYVRLVGLDGELLEEIKVSTNSAASEKYFRSMADSSQRGNQFGFAPKVAIVSSRAARVQAVGHGTPIEHGALRIPARPQGRGHLLRSAF